MTANKANLALDPHKISIGTANFYRYYGTISNSRMSLEELSMVDNLMNNTGIEKIDSAFSYLDFENDKFPKSFYRDRQVTSKISISDLSQRHVRGADGFIRIIETMLNFMGIDKLEALLIHDVSDYCSSDFEWFLNGLNQCKTMGLVSKLGVSIYKKKDLTQYIEKMKIDLIQIPLNPVNHEFLDPSIQRLIKEYSIQVQTRSSFLQGALLVPDFKIETEIGIFNQDSLSNWWNFLNISQEKPLSACLNFLTQFNFIESYVFGVESFAQLNGIINCNKSNFKYPWNGFKLKQQELNDPRLWKC